jgi:hypothetical protein
MFAIAAVGHRDGFGVLCFGHLGKCRRAGERHCAMRACQSLFPLSTDTVVNPNCTPSVEHDRTHIYREQNSFSRYIRVRHSVKFLSENNCSGPKEIASRAPRAGALICQFRMITVARR